MQEKTAAVILYRECKQQLPRRRLFFFHGIAQSTIRTSSTRIRDIPLGWKSHFTSGRLPAQTMDISRMQRRVLLAFCSKQQKRNYCSWLSRFLTNALETKEATNVFPCYCTLLTKSFVHLNPFYSASPTFDNGIVQHTRSFDAMTTKSDHFGDLVPEQTTPPVLICGVFFTRVVVNIFFLLITIDAFVVTIWLLHNIETVDNHAREPEKIKWVRHCQLCIETTKWQKCDQRETRTRRGLSEDSRPLA